MATQSQLAAQGAGVSVLVPVFNEAAGVQQMLSHLSETMRTMQCCYEILVIDDGSTDRSSEEIRRVDEPALRVITHAHNLGYGVSLTEGLLQAQYPLVVICDADGSYPVEQIPSFVTLLDRYEMVVGARQGAGEAVGSCRWIAKLWLRRIAEIVTGYPIPDLNSGFRAMRRETVLCLRHILPSRFSWTSTITVALLRQGASVAFVPIPYHTRLGVSKFRPIVDTARSLHCIARAVCSTPLSPRTTMRRRCDASPASRDSV